MMLCKCGEPTINGCIRCADCEINMLDKKLDEARKVAREYFRFWITCENILKDNGFYYNTRPEIIEQEECELYPWLKEI